VEEEPPPQLLKTINPTIIPMIGLEDFMMLPFSRDMIP